MSDQLKRQNIQALLAERRGYEARLVDSDIKSTLIERIEAVNASLSKLGYQEPKAPPPPKEVSKTTEKLASKTK